ncbi:hypothetical protein MSG28_013520 [Choristoneura fumiferana]|uniref:Uncharacterized protein n=1 Tax=Choristoneura fumiferana TaxID=7141 RepID=A0ACC0K7X5_CHOFU|nr:hypothetical protein MSG28_013520 [Choristoneura fumiferana]
MCPSAYVHGSSDDGAKPRGPGVPNLIGPSEASRVATECDDSADKVTSTLKSCLPLSVLPKSPRKPPSGGSNVKAGFKVESDGLPLLPLGDVDEEAYAVPWPAEPPLPDKFITPKDAIQ